MTRKAIIERTVKAINELPEDRAAAISTFAEFVMKQYEDYQLVKGIQQMASTGDTFNFLSEEEDLYSEADLKEIYNDKG